MNTERVKNVLIVLLSVIALSLASLIFITEDRYVMSAAQEAAIVAILERDDIHFRGEIVRDFRPLRQMEMRRYDYDLEGLAARFFGDENFTKETDDLFYNFTHEGHDDGKGMTYLSRSNTITFEIPRGISNEAFESMLNDRAAEVLATQYIESLMGMPPNMRHYSTTISYQGNWVVNFFTVYRGFILQNDHIRAYVTQDGITEIYYSRVNYGSFAGDPRGIFPPNEALLTLANHIRGLDRESTIIINDMRLSYFLTEERGQSVGIPAYVFAVYMGGMLRFNYVFNAYTNELLHLETSR